MNRFLPHTRFFQSNEDFRCPFSRDRDRIIHSSSFRRLEYKTQVFLNSSGDYFRTRLTHSLEVSQIARAIAKNLGLNESLSEAIALAHDLGHTPFGHAGGDMLDKILKDLGHDSGFDHNFQSFRVVSKLEKRYRDFDGLNLTFATLDGILKHSYPYDKHFLSDDIRDVFKPEFHPSLEAVVVDLSDEIAYISHDIDDGIKYGLIDFDLLADNQIVKSCIEYVESVENVARNSKIFRHRFTSRLISVLVYDVLESSDRISQKEPQCFTYPSLESLPIRHSKDIQTEIKKIKKILFRELYKHKEIQTKMFVGKKCIKTLYEYLSDDINLLPKELKLKIQEGGKIHRVCADYIASMSDRYALSLYNELK